MPAPSLPGWAQTVEGSLRSDPHFKERKILHFPGSPEFAESETGFFNAAASEVRSAATARPTSTADVSALVKILRSRLPATTPIAVRGAGHATYAGTAKAVGGVTIDMRGLRGVSILLDKKHVRIAAGEKWASVFAALGSHEPPLVTAGGRSPDVGAMGFLLGGGLSFFSGGYGFSADLVTAWEVVLASGQVVLARRDDESTADLWDALRGGSTNFGIVTAVEMSCFPHPAHFCSGVMFYLPLARQATLKAFHDMASVPSPAEAKQLVPISHSLWCITQASGVKIINTMVTTTGSPEQENLDAFTSVWGRIPFTGQIISGTQGQFIEKMGRLAPEAGKRTLHKSITVKLDLNLLNGAVDIWYTSVDSMRSVRGLQRTVVFHSLTVGMLEASCKTVPMSPKNGESAPSSSTAGSNFAGLSPRDGPLVLIEICTTYRDAKDDDLVARADTKYLEDVGELARQMGLAHRFIFPNYAWPSEGVLASYGDERLAFLRRVAARWDPEGFFQGQFVGGFKLKSAI